MNPFNSAIVHEDVHSFIFQHFTGKNLLAMSEVSKSWNKLVEVKIGSKVRVNLVNSSFSAKEVIKIAKSPRGYQHIAVKSSEANTLKRNRNCVLSDSDIVTFPQLKSLQLKIDWNKFKNYYWIFKTEMEQLEELKITFQKVYGDFSARHYRYESAAERKIGDFIRILAEFMNGLKNLKNLDLSDSSCDVNRELNEQFYEYPPQFALKRFSVSGDSDFEISLDTLETLVWVGDIEDYQFERFFSYYPKLTTLEIVNCSGFYPYPRQIKRNEKITKLRLDMKESQELKNLLEELLLKLPNLESLFISEL
jgi:hypothetical protein